MESYLRWHGSTTIRAGHRVESYLWYDSGRTPGGIVSVVRFGPATGWNRICGTIRAGHRVESYLRWHGSTTIRAGHRVESYLWYDSDRPPGGIVPKMARLHYDSGRTPGGIVSVVRFGPDTGWNRICGTIPAGHRVESYLWYDSGRPPGGIVVLSV